MKFSVSMLLKPRLLRTGMLSCIFLVAGAAQAANVDLTISKAAPSAAVSFTPFTYAITVGNAGNATTGASTITDTLPAHLYDLVATAAPTSTGGASCPSLADINNAIPANLRSPATAESTTNQTISWSVPSLPQGSSCVITLSVKAIAPGSYVNSATIAAAGSDTETDPGSNLSNVTTSVTTANFDLRITKELLTPATANFGDTVRYRITYYGDPVISVPNLGTFAPRTFDGWQSVMGTDGNSSGGVPYTSTIASCTTTNGATGCAASPPEVTAVSGAQMGGGQLLSQTGISLPAGSTLVIEEDVVFTAPRCGGLIVTNQATVSLGAPPQNDANGSNDEASVSLTLNSVGACVVARNTLSTTKILVNPADTVIDTEGEVVRYLIRSEYTSPDVPVAGIFYGDSFLYFNQNGSTATDAGPALTHEIWITGCTVDALGTGSACPPGPYPRQLQGPSTTFASNRFSFGDGSINGSGSIATGGFVQLALEERWSGIPACLGDRKSVKNQLDSVLIMPPNAPYQNFAVLTSSPTSAAVRIDPDVPACVDIASNKRVTPTNPTADFPMTFGLQFTNNSLAAVGFANTATNVTVTDTLSSSFTPTAVSCSVTSGTATAPTVSLANITGPTHVFSAVIPSMDDGSTVTCSITGVASSPGSFSNTVTANGTSGTGRTGNYDSIANNNSSTVNYGLIAPATVSLTKTISGAVDGYVAGSTFPVTVSCVVTPAAGGAATTVPQTVNLVPNVAQTLSIPPTTGEQNVACSVTEGAAPATASSGFTYGTPAITPVSFAAPAGGSAAPAVTVNNPLSQAMGSLTVTPTVSGAVAGYGGQPFAITVNCTGPGVAGFPQTLNLVANASQSVPVPLGGDCTVSETQPPANSGYAFNAPTYSAAASVIITGDNTIDIQNVLVSAAAPAPVATPLLDLKMLIGLMVLMLVLGVFTARQRMR